VPKTSSNSVPPRIKSQPGTLLLAHSKPTVHKIQQCTENRCSQQTQPSRGSLLTAKHHPEALCSRKNTIVQRLQKNSLQLTEKHSPQPASITVHNIHSPPPSNGAHIPLFPSLIPPCRLTHLLHNHPRPPSFVPSLIFLSSRDFWAPRPAYATLYCIRNSCYIISFF
jgi:hypothetical protein